MEVSELEQSLRAAGYRRIAGCDEAGRGALAGPVVAAAVVLDYAKLPSLLMDSKRLTRQRREQIAAEIKELAVAWAVCRVEPREIERINILQASLTAMAGAVARLGLKADHVVLDGNIVARIDSMPVQCIVRGDATISCIAAASIIAKVERDFIMAQYAKQFPRYHFEQNRGYPTDAHLAALRRHGPCRLHRRTFKPVREKLAPLLFRE